MLESRDKRIKDLLDADQRHIFESQFGDPIPRNLETFMLNRMWVHRAAIREREKELNKSGRRIPPGITPQEFHQKLIDEQELKARGLKIDK